MIARPAKFFFPFSRPLTALLVLTVLLAPASQAKAQNILMDIFGGLFEGRHAPRRPPQSYHAPGETARPRRASDAAQRAEKARHPKAQEQIVFSVAVLGDTLAQLLADGLEDAFAESPQIGVLHKGKENSGLVRNDYFDWLKAAQETAGADKKPEMAVVMIGSNDHQPLSDAGQTLEPLSPRWREIYAARVDALIQSFKEKNIPLVWVGLPVMKSERFSADVAQLNDIYRSSAAKAEIPFIDLWDIFADEHGRYSPYGPDVNGQSVKLRASDGVHFTAAGARKVAHFVEGEIKRVFEARQRPAEESGAPPPAPQAQPEAASPPPTPDALLVFRPPEVTTLVAPPALPPDRPAIGPVQQLTGGTPKDEDLAKREKPRSGEQAASPARAVAEHVFVEGGARPTRPGRADDFSWPAADKPTPYP